MADCCIDHLVVTSPSLDPGASFVKKALGVGPQPGGKHPLMGTHNLLLSLGGSQYLEVISPDPAAPPNPGRPRLFGLDKLSPDAPPVFATWVARTKNIRSAVASSSEPLGEIVSMSRGNLNWLLTIPASGLPPLDGAAPALIEWPAGIHPTASLKDYGLRLVEVKIFHPDPARVSKLLASIDFEGPLSVFPTHDHLSPHLLAVIDTPRGICHLPLN